MTEPDVPALIRDLLRLPRTPADILRFSPSLKNILAGLPLEVVALLSGMMAEPRYQANVQRLEMLSRCAAGLSRGHSVGNRRQLDQLLNELAHLSRATRLEDPPENAFATRVATANGEFAIIGGTSEHAAFQIDTLLEASEAAPDGPARDQAIADVYVLLRLADDIFRASLGKVDTIGGGNPGEDIPVPTAREQVRLRAIITFKPARLRSLGIDEADLAPFIAKPSDHRRTLRKQIGTSVFDARPLLKLPNGDLIVVSPGALASAIKLRLAAFAREAGPKYFQRALLRVCLERVDETRLMRMPTDAPAQSVGAFSVRQAFLQIEPGRWVHVFAVADSFEPGALLVPAKGGRSLARFLAQSIKQAHTRAKENNYRSGLTLLMGCGWGRAMKMPGPGRLPRGWEICGADCADFATIGANASGEIIDLWRLLTIERVMAQRGYRLGYMNGVLNLFSWWIANDHQLIPEQEVDLERGAPILISPGEVASARAAARTRLGSRSLPLPVGGFDRVLRKQPETYFPNAASDRQYISIGAVRERVLIAAVDTPQPCWVILDQESSGSFTWHYQVWSAALDWTARLVTVLEGDGGRALPSAPCSIRVRVVESEGEWGASPDPAACGPQILEPFTDPRINCIVVHCGPAWNRYLQCEENVAERALVAAVAEGLASLSGVSIDAIDVARRTVGGPDARHLRAVAATSATDIIGVRSKRFDALSASASALAKTNLDCLLGSPAPGQHIEGVDACVAALHMMVSALGSTLCKTVRKYDRAAIIKSALEAAQSATYEEASWRRSYRAQLGLHGDTPDVRRVAYEQTLRINAVRISSRIIAEMASAQTRAIGRLVPGKADMIELMTGASTLVHLAETANEIEAGLTPALITFSPGGDVLTQRRFTDAIQTPMSKMMSDAHVDFEIARPSATSGAPLKIDPLFERAIEAEFGVSLAQLFETPQTFVRACLEENVASIALPRSMIESLIVRDVKVTRNAAQQLVDRLLLRMRPRWDRAPRGFGESDIDPWRFGRRLALVARPFVQLSVGGDEMIHCAPTIIEEALRYQMNAAWEGRLSQSYWTSAAMRSWIGRAGHKLGEAFNLEVAAMLEEKGLKAKPNVTPGALTKTKNDPSLGDVDVVCWRPGGKTLWVIEAKDLTVTRTVAEIADRIRDFTPGERKPGKKTKLQRHLNRVAYVRQHAAGAAAFAGLEPNAVIKGAVVFSVPQPMMFSSPSDPDAASYLVHPLAELIRTDAN